jgi:hypothetical protein
MNFKKMPKPQQSEINKTYTVDDLKMVKVTFTFPVWKTSSFDDICSEFEDSYMNIRDNGMIEESDISFEDLSDWNKDSNKNNDWYFYHRDIEVTVKDILEQTKNAFTNKSKPKPKPKRKGK